MGIEQKSSEGLWQTQEEDYKSTGTLSSKERKKI